MSRKHVFIGCGGSGVRTVTRLNALLAQDQVWRGRMDEDVYYLLIDTDTAEFDEFDRALASHMGRATPPHVGRIVLSQGVDTIQPDIHQYMVKPFDGKTGDPGLLRLQEQWWSQRDGRPFKAAAVRDIATGAGQCPPVSYFLTWKNMETINDELARIFTEIKKRSTDPQPMENIDFVIVAGLAGGTGRGTWSTVAFKLREVCNRNNRQASPSVVLFDSSTFKDIHSQHPENSVQMDINSLTGISELSCWVVNRSQSGKRYEYRLPSLRTPEDRETDVLRVDLELDEANAAPVRNAFLVFGESPVAALEDHDRYYDMAGTLMYLRLVTTRLNRNFTNGVGAYWAMGAATFEVPVDDLRQFYESRVRVKAARALKRSLKADVSSASDTFKKESLLAIDISKTARDAFRADAKGTVVQQVCHRVVLAKKNDLAALATALADDRPADEIIEDVVPAVSEPDEGMVKRAVEEVFSSLKQDDVSVAGAFVQRHFKETGSVASVMALTDDLVAWLTAEIDAFEGANMVIETGQDLASQIKDRSGRELLGMAGRRYSETEQREILDAASRQIPFSHYRAICEALKSAYAAEVSSLEVIRNRAKAVVDTVDVVEKVFARRSFRGAEEGGYGGHHLFNTVFADAEKPEVALPGKFSPTRFQRRVLKPAMCRGEEDEILGDVKPDRRLLGLVEEEVFASNGAPDRSVKADDLRDRLEETIRATARLDTGFIADNFAILAVIESLRGAWEMRLNGAAGDADRVRELTERFKSFFGVEPRLDGERWSLPRANKMLEGMIASIAATCRPYCLMRHHNQEKIAPVSVYSPLPPSDAERQSIESNVQSMFSDRAVSVTAIDDNPFVMIAFSTEKIPQLEDLRSLDYWKDSSHKQWLKRAEDPDGDSIFDETTTKGGLGYISPIYVRNDDLRSWRWRPWVDADASVQEQSRNEIVATLFYALLEPVGATTAKLQAVGWALPLIRKEKNRWFSFARTDLEWDAAKKHSRNRVPDEWCAGDKIGQGIEQVVETLAQNGVWLDRLKQEAESFWNSVVPTQGMGPATTVYRDLIEGARDAFNDQYRRSRDEDAKGVWRELTEYAQGLLDEAAQGMA